MRFPQEFAIKKLVWEEDAGTSSYVKCAHYVFSAGKENPFCIVQLAERQYRVIFSKHSLVMLLQEL
jgi:hypothetical protein